MVSALCDRRNGVGADGLVVLTPAAGTSVRMTFWNSDGSRAAMCGNAALCSARLSVSLGLVPPGSLCLLTDAGTVEARADGQETALRSDARSRSPSRGAGAGTGQRRGLDSRRNGRRAAPGGSGPGHRGRRRARPGPLAPVRPPAGTRRAPTPTSWRPGPPASPGSSGPTSGEWKGRRWPAGPGPWRPRSPWPTVARLRCRCGSGPAAGRSSWCGPGWKAAEPWTPGWGARAGCCSKGGGRCG